MIYLRSNTWGAQVPQHPCRWTCLKGLVQVLAYPWHQWSSLAPLEESSFACREVMVAMPALVRNASWIPVSWLRDCEFLYSSMHQSSSLFSFLMHKAELLSQSGRYRPIKDNWSFTSKWRLLPLLLAFVFCVSMLWCFTSFGVKDFGKSIAVFAIASDVSPLLNMQGKKGEPGFPGINGLIGPQVSDNFFILI